MTQSDSSFNEKLLTFLEVIAKEGASNAAKGFSAMIGQDLSVTAPNIRLVHINEIPYLMGGPEKEAVGIYLRVEGDLTGQIMLVMPYEKAFEIVNLLLDMGDEIPKELGRLERSALAEVGNLTASFFLNSVASMTGLKLLPTPPAVIIDMIGAILDIIVATSGGVSEHVLLLGTNFTYKNRSVNTEFWVIPDTNALERFTNRSIS